MSAQQDQLSLVNMFIAVKCCWITAVLEPGLFCPYRRRFDHDKQDTLRWFGSSTFTQFPLKILEKVSHYDYYAHRTKPRVKIPGAILLECDEVKPDCALRSHIVGLRRCKLDRGRKNNSLLQVAEGVIKLAENICNFFRVKGVRGQPKHIQTRPEISEILGKSRSSDMFYW